MLAPRPYVNLIVHHGRARAERQGASRDCGFRTDTLEESDCKATYDRRRRAVPCSNNGHSITTAKESAPVEAEVITGNIGTDIEDFGESQTDQGLLAGVRFNLWFTDGQSEQTRVDRVALLAHWAQAESRVSRY